MAITLAGGIATRALHAGASADPTTGAVLTPIVQSTTYRHESVGTHKGHTYSRASNPTVAALEHALGELEEAPPAVCFSSGMASITTLFLATLRAGDHVVASDVIYGGTYRLLEQVLTRLGVSTTFADTASPGAVAAAIRPNTRLIFVETPANPTLKLTDIASIAPIARRADALFVVDNTFLTAVGLRPLELGADVSLYSTTKYIEGHNATLGGAIVSRRETLLERLGFIRKTIGTIQSPMESWLTLQGLRTLPLRLERQSSTAGEVARWLEQHPLVARVHHPSLDSFPQRDLARRQHGLHGGIVSFELHGGLASGIALMNAVRLCCLAENLGAVQTLITHPASMTHGDVPPEKRAAAGISDGLVRLSVGLEDAQDLIDDLDRALTSAGALTHGS